jgi:hypothetical protein
MAGVGIFRLALEGLTRHPREMVAANALTFLAASLPLAFLPNLGAWGRPVFAGALWVLGLWGWICLSALAWACDAILGGRRPSRAGLLNWLKTQGPERILAFVVGSLALAWIVLTLRFYGALGLPPALSLVLAGLLGAVGFWLLLALLASVGLAAPGGRRLRPLWKAALLLPLAYWWTFLKTALLGLVLSGLPALLVGLEHWSAPVLLAPFLLSPLFTVALFASHLVLTVRTLLEAATGGAGPLVPAWRELWNPWR